MIEVLLLAFALSMDAFAVSIGLGAKKNGSFANLAFKAGLFFGLFQALMPLLGYVGGRSLLGLVSHYTSYIAFGLLLFIGAKMIYEGINEGEGRKIGQITYKLLFTLAVATSIDAMAAGFSLTLLDVNPYLACCIIGLITFFISIIGVIAGRNASKHLEGKAEMFGGAVLIAIGFRMLMF